LICPVHYRAFTFGRHIPSKTDFAHERILHRWMSFQRISLWLRIAENQPFFRPGIRPMGPASFAIAKCFKRDAVAPQWHSDFDFGRLPTPHQNQPTWPESSRGLESNLSSFRGELLATLNAQLGV